MSYLETGLTLISNSINNPIEKAMVSRWQREYEAHKRRSFRRQSILNAISDGYDTISEIVARTSVPPTTARRIIERFIAQKKVSSVKVKTPYSVFEYRYEVV